MPLNGNNHIDIMQSKCDLKREISNKLNIEHGKKMWVAEMCMFKHGHMLRDKI